MVATIATMIKIQVNSMEKMLSMKFTTIHALVLLFEPSGAFCLTDSSSDANIPIFVIRLSKCNSFCSRPRFGPAIFLGPLLLAGNCSVFAAYIGVPSYKWPEEDAIAQVIASFTCNVV